MKKLFLMILLVALLACSSLSLAFDVTVGVTDENGKQTGSYQVVDMQPVHQENGTATAAKDSGQADDQAMVAAKN